MNGVKAYLLRLVLCGFLISLSTALLRGKRAGKIHALCGGCLMILTALRPLLRVDLSALPDLMTGLTQSERQALAREKNEAILRRLVEEQTVQWLEQQAEELQISATFAVTAEETEDGLWIPTQVAVSGQWTQEQREALQERIERQLGLPPIRQQWEGG